MHQLKNLVRPYWLAIRSGLKRVQQRLRIEASVQRQEERLAQLNLWSFRKPLHPPILFVYKLKDLSDHLLFAMLNHCRGSYSGLRYLSFSRYEKPRDNPALGAGKLMRAVQQHPPAVIFAYDSPLSIGEMRFLGDRQISVASNTVGLDSFFCGGASSQAEAFDILRSYGWYFVNHAPHVPRLRQEGVNAFALPMGYEPRWFHPLANVRPRYDVLFVGDINTPLNSNRRALLEHISLHFNLAVLSYKPPGIPGVLHIGAETNPYRLNRILNQARVVLGSDRLGDTSALNQLPGQYIFYEDEFYLRQRAYLVLGAGCCYMVERHPEIQRQFEDGREIVLWGDNDELIENIAYFLKHEEERRAIGLAGHRRAVSQYTVAHMMQFIFSTMGLIEEQSHG